MFKLQTNIETRLHFLALFGSTYFAMVATGIEESRQTLAVTVILPTAREEKNIGNELHITESSYRGYGATDELHRTTQSEAMVSNRALDSSNSPF